MRLSSLHAPGWRSGPVLIAESFVDRLRGLVGRPEGLGIVIRGASVHGLGLRRPLWAVGLDGDGGVLSVALLRPRHLVCSRGAVHILELPLGTRPPTIGSTVTEIVAPGSPTT